MTRPAATLWTGEPTGPDLTHVGTRGKIASGTLQTNAAANKREKMAAKREKGKFF